MQLEQIDGATPVNRDPVPPQSGQAMPIRSSLVKASIVLSSCDPGDGVIHRTTGWNPAARSRLTSSSVA